MKKINVLSLCDGMSCGQIALSELGIDVENYYAAEIKQAAINLTKYNFPNTIHIGDVNKVKFKDGVLYAESGNYNIDSFDLVMFGSPCQSFSRAMKTDMRVGLEDEIRSGIFLQCNRILKEVNPKYFLMENVIMKKEDEDIITKLLGVDPIRINSKKVTAQMRDRLYWTNIPIGDKLIDIDVSVSDILTDGYYPFSKARCLMKNDSHGYYNGCGWTSCKRFYRWYYKAFSTMIFPSKEDYDRCLEEFNSIVKGEKATAKMFDDYNGNVFDCARYLWKEERARLQGIPVKYIQNLSEKDASDLIGDGWTIDVIKHILGNLKRCIKLIEVKDND